MWPSQAKVGGLCFKGSLMVGYLETVTLEAGLAEGDVTLLGEELGDKQEAV